MCSDLLWGAGMHCGPLTAVTSCCGWFLLYTWPLLTVHSCCAAVRVETSLREPWRQPERLTATPPTPTVAIHRALEGTGFHRNLVTEIQLAPDLEPNVPPRWQNAPLIVMENITRDMYVDLDQLNLQLSTLVEFGGPQVIASGYMDTEKPAASSSSHTLLVYTQLDRGRGKVELPVHFRYQVPDISPYRTVTVPLPHVLIQSDSLSDSSSLKLPCNVSSVEWCHWKTVRLQDIDPAAPNTSTLQTDIPCGLQEHTVLVVIATVFVTLGGTLYLVSKL